MGWLDFDKVRYWDIRRMHNFPIIEKPRQKAAPSDWRNRPDSLSMIAGDVAQAQLNKDA